jgi:type IV secretory pathway TraG/TraD family ATPase VirD4
MPTAPNTIGVAVELPSHLLSLPHPQAAAGLFDSLPPNFTVYLGGAIALAAFGGLAAGLLNGRDSADIRRQNRIRDFSPAWASPKDVKDLVINQPDHNRLVLGTLANKTVANPARRSLMVMAPTGAGKTPRVVVPAVLRHHGPALIASVKSDVLRLTIARRRKEGPVWVFDPTGATGEQPSAWSPLSGIRTYADALKAAAWLTDSSKVEGRGVEDQRYWDALGRKLLAPMLFAAARCGMHISQVVQWTNYRDEETVAQLLNELGDADAISAWAANRAREAKTKSSVYGTAEVILEAFGHPAVRDALAADPESKYTINPATLLTSGGTLYLVAPASDQALFTPIFETLANAVLREVELLYARSGLPLDPALLVMLDEAANIAPLRRLDQLAAKGAGEGIILVSVWQDDGQLNTIYGQDRARTVKSNHTAKLYLPGINDEQTLKALSESIGPHTVRRRTDSWDAHGRKSSSSQPVEEPLAPPSWLRRLGSGTAIVITGSHKPMRLRVPGWYEDKAMRALVDPVTAAAFDAQFAPAPAGRGSQ